jgi:hypothetical protein
MKHFTHWPRIFIGELIVITHTAVSNSAMKTSINNFKVRDEALKIDLSLITIGNSREDALRRWNRRPGFVLPF